MVWLEKIEITNEYVKYYYYVERNTKKGVLTLFPKTKICRVEEFCEGDGEDSCYESNRGHAFCQMMRYVKNDNYPDEDFMAWY